MPRDPMDRLRDFQEDWLGDETSIDVSGIGPGADGRNFSGDIASETFTATGAEPGFTGPTGYSTNGGPMTWTSGPVTSSDPRDLFAGGDPMFQNYGNPMSRMPGFAQGMGLGNSAMGPDPTTMGGGMPGFTDALRGGAGKIGGAVGGVWDWIKENPEGAAALASVAANIYAANEQGELADEEMRMRRDDRERQRETSSVLTPILAQTMARRRR